MDDGQRVFGLYSLAHIERGDQRDLPPTDGPLIGAHDPEADRRANVAYFRRNVIDMPDPGTPDSWQGEGDPFEPKVLIQAKPNGGGYANGIHYSQPGYAEAMAEILSAKPKLVKFETKDSGQREDFSTGSRRDTREGKGRYDLLPPYAIQRLAQVYERGALKYGDRNWELGQPLSRFLDSALRHTFQVLGGKTDEDHAGQACWNLLAVIQIKHLIDEGLLPAELDDLPR